MAKQRKTFDISLKLNLIRMIKKQEQSVQNISETMDVGATAIPRWVQQYGVEQKG